MIEEVLVQGVRNLQPAGERECRDVLTAVGDLDQLALEVTDVGFEVVALPHLDGEKMVVVLLDPLMRGVLSEERFDYLLEVVERM